MVDQQCELIASRELLRLLNFLWRKIGAGCWIEVLTAACLSGHLRSKAQAGFHVYALSSDRATLTTRIEDDHHLTETFWSYDQ
jgi:hypothetical protein